MRITPLASGSLGNSVLVESGRTKLLIDAGLAQVELEERLAAVGVRPRSLSGVFLTHRHRDHVRGVPKFCRAHRVPIFTARRTARVLGTECQRLVRRVDGGQPFAVGELELMPVHVRHDAPQTLAVVVTAADRRWRYGHATDLGCLDGDITTAFRGCDALLLEFNHDAAMLRDGRDPPHLKRRIGSAEGHLSNDVAAELLGTVEHDALQAVFLAHVSRRNNTPEHALAAADAALRSGRAAGRVVALQDEVTRTVELV